jgi:TATA-box binding protein (TBP) (component of TFIID and TFIIIB)
MSATLNIDQEWENFMTTSNCNDSDEDDFDELAEILKQQADEYLSANLTTDIETDIPKCSNIYISTKTKIAYLNTTINLAEIFWNIPIIQYYLPKTGVVKKQMKFNSITQSELDFIQEKITNDHYLEENIITHIDNPNGRIKFKDIRKISIGISKKDIMSYRSKKKSAFYNCFVIILRIKINDVFKEFHVKVFNTGKLEIPGIQNEDTFHKILNEVINTLQPYIEMKLCYKPDSEETVLINSNFNCGFFINRESLLDILKFKYNIQCIYDPCSYPGIQSKFYYNPSIGIQNGCQISEENKELYKNIKKVSFMIFRTGSVLIVGKCDENVLYIIYDFLKNILTSEYANIFQKKHLSDTTALLAKDKTRKIRKKSIIIDSSKN